VGDGALIGMGARVLNGARIGERCLVGAGALITEGKVFDAGLLIVGSPARALRLLSDQELAMLDVSAAHYAEKAAQYAVKLQVAAKD
jgi:carbonic anhydrase/acetyltransferase-like protein (isoleucine patch superfamily)